MFDVGARATCAPGRCRWPGDANPGLLRGSPVGEEVGADDVAALADGAVSGVDEDLAEVGVFVLHAQGEGNGLIAGAGDAEGPGLVGGDDLPADDGVGDDVQVVIAGHVEPPVGRPSILHP